MPETPNFNSHIPTHLLEGLSPKDIWIMESISILNQKNDWQSQTLKEQSVTVNNILTEARRTNGRITKSERDIVELQDNVTKREDDFRVLDILFRIVKTKTFWVAVGVFFLLVLPWIYSFHLTANDLISYFLNK
jgi:hypothetical protein